jgi:hypothetical protein
VHHDAPGADLPMHDEVNAVERRQELGNELSDGLSTLYKGRRRDVAVNGVFGEAACDFVEIRLGPQRAESGDHFVR